MDPGTIQAIQALAVIMEKLGTLPIVSMFFLAQVSPWIFMVWLALGQNRRFEAVKRMYEDNVKLVESYEAIAKRQDELVIYSTQTMTEVLQHAKNNLFCPIVRKNVNQKEINT